jgi:hypothetical protein
MAFSILGFSIVGKEVERQGKLFSSSVVLSEGGTTASIEGC